MNSATNMLPTTASESLETAASAPVECISPFFDDAAALDDDFLNGDTGNDHDQPVFEKVITISNLPPLDQITICSESSTSDNSSNFDVSSVTTDENDEMARCFSISIPKESLTTTATTNQALRTIFDRYWEKNRLLQQVPAESLETPPSCDDETSSSNTYERTLLDRTKNVVGATKNLSRRRIFMGLPSTPDLVNDPERLPIKAHSDSCLLTKKAKPPCLRRSRFSISTTSTSSSSQEPDTPTSSCRRTSSTTSVTSIVTFNPKVDIVVYRRPVELYASNGWSDYFSS